MDNVIDLGKAKQRIGPCGGLRFHDNLSDNLRYLLMEDYWRADVLFDQFDDECVVTMKEIRKALDQVLTEDADDDLMARVHAAYLRLADEATDKEIDCALDEFFKAANYTPQWDDDS